MPRRKSMSSIDAEISALKDKILKAEKYTLTHFPAFKG